MINSTFEEIIQTQGKLIYTNKGDSMMPLICEGKDLVIITKAEGRLKKYDVPLYKRDNGQYVLHRILKVRSNDYVICGDNRYYTETGITDKHIIGVLAAVVKNGKEISVNNPFYKLYVHLWCDFFIIRKIILKVKRFMKR